MAGCMRAWAPGMDFGVGIDSLSGEIKGDGVEYGDPVPVTGAEGQAIGFSVSRMETSEQLEEALSVSVEASASFGFGGGSAGMDFARSVEVNSYSIFLVVRAEVCNSFRRIRNASLRPAVAELLRQGKAERFREQCGDLFASGMATGGLYVAVLEIHTRDAAERSAMSAQVEGSYGTFSAEASFSHAVATATKTAKLTVRSFQLGGQDTSQPTTAEAMVQKAAAFAVQVKGSQGVPYEMLLQDYRTLDLPDGVNEIDLTTAKEVLHDLNLTRGQLRKLLADVQYVILYPDQFISPDLPALQATRDGLQKAINAVKVAASRCIEKPKEAAYPDVPIPAVRLPERKGGGAGLVITAQMAQAIAALAREQRRRQEEEATKPVLRLPSLTRQQMATLGSLRLPSRAP